MSGALAVLGLASLAAKAVDRELSTPRDLQATSHSPSSECRRCHPSHYESWSRTFHASMTRDAQASSVLGDFGDASFAYGGITARMRRTDDGGFEMRFEGPEGVLSRARIERTVGSRRIQQYLAREDDVYFRLPVAWNVEESRWMHMNGAFLTPDPPWAEDRSHVAVSDYHRHVTRWNDNCVFCHNVGPSPGWDEPAGRFRTEVAELGVACGACHGPAAEHVARNHHPLRRYMLHLSEEPDPTVVNPARLTPERSAEVCGRCHGQRITEDVGAFLREGDRFVPGEDLHRYSEPLARDTRLRGEQGVFAPRFWEDGTPRLTAYEYQGLLQSPCARGGLTCTSCHGMHEGDPRGQLRPTARGDAACTSCHAELSTSSTARAHARHRDVRCVDCHMPRVVYGLVGAHRSHRVEAPNPAAQQEHGRPDACSLCHADRSERWVLAGYAHLFGGREVPTVAAETSSVEAWALGGDPIERAVAAAALGRADVPLSDEARARRVGSLLTIMTDDPYPAVRRIAWRSVTSLGGQPALPGVGPYEPTAGGEARRAWVDAATRALHPIAPDPQRLAGLRARADTRSIEIGE